MVNGQVVSRRCFDCLTMIRRMFLVEKLRTTSTRIPVAELGIFASLKWMKRASTYIRKWYCGERNGLILSATLLIALLIFSSSLCQHRPIHTSQTKLSMVARYFRTVLASDARIDETTAISMLGTVVEAQHAGYRKRQDLMTTATNGNQQQRANLHERSGMRQQDLTVYW